MKPRHRISMSPTSKLIAKFTRLAYGAGTYGARTNWACTLVIVALCASSADAYYTFQDTGDLLAPGRYAVGGELQLLTKGDSGANILGRFDGGISDEWGFRGIVGLGETDFQAGGFLKWVPIPDVDNQPAVGVMFGGLIATYTADRINSTEFAARAYPFVSKKFDVEFGQLTPYASLPLGVRNFDGDSSSTSQMILGSRFIHPDMAGAQWFAELGFDFHKAPGYVSFGATFPLNEEYLIDLWP
jgi:hypothetical protein